jgi:triacylglycerol esterase/lipase EstA (alpha/beta hydrolase family)
MNKFQGYLKDAGIPSDDIYEPSYPYLLSIDRMKDRLFEQLQEIDQKYPKTTQYTIITHSLGQFVALYTLLENGWTKRVKNFVSLGGFAFGQNSKPALCLGSVCGPIWSQMVPYKNDFVLKLFERHKTSLSELNKCSVYSAHDDKINDPLDAGNFTDSINVKLEDKYSHRDLIRERKVFDEMHEKCFKQAKQPRCVTPPASSTTF